jgi:glutaconate CoA-transferase subunit A
LIRQLSKYGPIALSNPGSSSRMAPEFHTDINVFVGHIADGDTVAIPTMLGGYSGVSMVATRALARRGIRGLNIVCVPSSSLQADMLIGAGCVASIQAGAVLLYEYGPAARYVQAFHDGSITVKEATCPAIQGGLTAAERGLPFMPVRGILGSDILANRPDWTVIDNPFPPYDPVVVVPAIRPDVTLIHAPMADRHGNLWIGQRGSLKLMAHASAKTLATFETLYDGNLFESPDKVPGLIAAPYVTALSHQPGGYWPLHFGPDHPEDVAHMKIYAAASQTAEGFKAYLEQYVMGEA